MRRHLHPLASRVASVPQVDERRLQHGPGDLAADQPAAREDLARAIFADPAPVSGRLQRGFTAPERAHQHIPLGDFDHSPGRKLDDAPAYGFRDLGDDVIAHLPLLVRDGPDLEWSVSQIGDPGDRGEEELLVHSDLFIEPSRPESAAAASPTISRPAGSSRTAASRAVRSTRPSIEANSCEA